MSTVVFMSESITATQTITIRKNPCTAETGLCFGTCCMQAANSSASTSCHHGDHRDLCEECAHAQRMFASIPKRGRAYTAVSK